MLNPPLVVGVDEAGRGCLAGPVVAAAVVWDEEVQPSSVTATSMAFRDPVTDKMVVIRDSKTMTEKQRVAAAAFIRRSAKAWHVASVPAHEIDRSGILQATMKAMTVAIKHVTSQGPAVTELQVKVDGNYFHTDDHAVVERFPIECVVAGDSKYVSIAAASILSKTHRDEVISKSPFAARYGWAKNKAYGTKQHVDAILEHGVCVEHRRSFQVRPRGTTKAKPKGCPLLEEGEIDATMEDTGQQQASV